MTEYRPVSIKPFGGVMPSSRGSAIFSYTSLMYIALVSATCSDETGTIFGSVYEYYIRLCLFTPAGGYAPPHLCRISTNPVDAFYCIFISTPASEFVSAILVQGYSVTSLY